MNLGPKRLYRVLREAAGGVGIFDDLGECIMAWTPTEALDIAIDKHPLIGTTRYLVRQNETVRLFTVEPARAYTVEPA